VNIKHLFFIKQVLPAICVWLCSAGFAYAAVVTTVVDNVDPANDTKVNVDISRLMPIAENNTWTYDLMKGTNPSPESIEAGVGFREKIGGGCLAVNPVVFGADLTLYIGNYGDYLSIHGIHINRWKGLDDLVMKFETRNRAN